MRTSIPSTAVALALAVSASAAHAALSVNVNPVVEAVYAANPDGTAGAALSAVPNAPAFYEVHFLVSVTGADSTHSLGGVSFGIDDLGRQPTYRSSSSGPGNPATPTEGLAPPPGSSNTDDFTDASSHPVTLNTAVGAYGPFDALVKDGLGGWFQEGFVVGSQAITFFTGAAGDNNQLNLEDIAFSLKSGKVTSAQRTIGQNAPFDLGYITVYWDRSLYENFLSDTLSLNNTIAPYTSSVQYTVDTFASSSSTAAGTIGSPQIAPNSNVLDFSAVTIPEPASLSLLALGTPFLFRRRKPPIAT
jgi:hypothetical protein